MNAKYERQLIKNGYQFISGVDEAGRGAFAGPLVAAAVILDFNRRGFFSLIKDSKLLTASRREKALEKILEKSLAWSIAVVSNKEIDNFGLGYSNKFVLQKANSNLKIKPDFVLSDYMSGVDYKMNFEMIKQGDRKIISIAAASIIAKVFRDRIMKSFDKKYPEYGFHKHKGYGTRAHRQAIYEFGPCEIHRRSFQPFKSKLLDF